MVQLFLEWLNTSGLPGLLFIMFLEGLSLPIPGFIVVFSYGYSLSPGYVNTAFIAIWMSISYSIGSLIPYYIGIKLEESFPKRLKKRLDKGMSFFNRFGIWSIALSRPLAIGNYISFVAGMGRVHLIKYLILTFLGIYPWSYGMIFLGDYFNGNYEAFRNYFSSYSMYGYGGVFVCIAFILLFYYKKLRQRKEGLSVMGEGGQSE